MDVQNVDRRVRRTKKLLLQGLTKLMAEKKINKITVKELTDMVDVNRATFYLYYENIFDMVEKVETEMIDYLNDALEKYGNKGDDGKSIQSFINYVLLYIEENSQLCRILLGPDGDYAYVEKLKKVIRDNYPSQNTQAGNARENFLMPFIISGCIGAIQQWLEDDMKIPTKEMAAFIYEMVLNCSGKKK